MAKENNNDLNLRKQLETELATVSGIELSLYKDTDLLVAHYHGKEFAHFHNQHPEIDIRVPTKFAKRHKLGEPYASANHPNRSKKSIWRVFPYGSKSDIDQIVDMVKILLPEEYRN